MFVVRRQPTFYKSCYLRQVQSFSQGNSSSNTKNDVSEAHPLKGVRILDLTRIIAGPFCTMILADLGAEVIKVEKPGSGDESRKWGPPFLPNSNDAVYFLSQNRNKKSACIDIKKGAHIIRELAIKSDVLVENYVPGKLSEYGLDFESIKKVAPNLVYCSLTGYGSEGPYKNRPGYDVIAASVGGLLHITGEKHGPPSKVGVAVTDIATGLYAHGAILAALLQRQHTGRGQKIDVDLFSTQVAMLINVASNYLNSGVEAGRWGTEHSSIVPYQAFKTSTGYLTVGAGSDEQFKMLCKLMTLNDLCEDSKFKTNRDRVCNRAELIELLSAEFLRYSTDYWMKKFENSSFPVGPVNSIQEVFADKHIQAIELVKTLPHPLDGSVKVVGPPVKFSDAKNDARTAPPFLGQHTNDVLADVLNYSQTEIEELRRQNIIQ